MVQQASWGRWGEERAVLDEALGRAEVALALATRIVDGRVGPLARTLGLALRSGALDRHLDHIAAAARQPAVRALALDALIHRRARWPSGQRWDRIEKPNGRGRSVTTFDERPIEGADAAQVLIARGVADPSPVVRRVALAGVIKHLSDTTAGRAFATELLGDRSRGVAERAAFILRLRTPQDRP